MSARFYLVWSPQGASPPRHRHVSHQAAREEAERLARANPGREFFVVLALSRSCTVASITEKLQPDRWHRCADDEIPF